MASKTRQSRHRTSQEESARIDPILFDEDGLDMEDLSEQELEEILFSEDDKQESGFFNLPTIAGFSLIMVGIAYIFQQLGFAPGLDLSVLASMLPWIAGILIILWALFSWRPGRKSKPKKKQKMSARERREERAASKSESRSASRSDRSDKGKLRKSKDKSFGVAAGIAEYFGIDPTLVRIAFVIGTIASGGPFFLAYLLLSFVMPNPEKHTFEERITIIRDS